MATLVADEFFEQGDLELQHLQIVPEDMMNREKIDQLPAMQVGFIDAICMPVYQVSGLYPISFIISPNEVFGDIMVLASPPPRPPVDPDDVNALIRKIFNVSLSNFIWG